MKIIHWNVLANSLSEHFPNVPSEFLTWNYRKELIIQKVVELQADIICLVEIDEIHQNIFTNILTKYAQYYYKKVSADNYDGCLTLVNCEKYQILTEKCIQLMEDRSQIAVICKLQDLHTGYIFTVISTHLKAKPGFETVRLDQCKKIIQHIDYTDDCILVGDFNDIPGSLCYNYLVNECKFVDSYADLYTKDAFTTFKKRDKVVCRIIDYIFYRSHTLQPVLRLEYLDKKDLPEIGLPSHTHPSDHVIIGTVFVNHEERGPKDL